jgi:ribose transport system substrate-binding protein
MTIWRNAKAIALAAIAVAAMVVLAACGSSGGSRSTASSGSGGATTAGTTSGSTTSGGAATPGVLTMDQLTTGYESDPPTSGPPPAKGKTVWWVSCGQSIPDCSVPAGAGQAAAKMLGWSFHIADGALNQGGGNLKAMNTAVAAKPDAIVVHGIACDGITAPLRAAKAAGIPVIGVETLDCNDQFEESPGPSLFTVPMLYSAKAPTAADFFQSWGTFGASFLIDATGGKATTLVQDQTAPTLGLNINRGFEDTFGKCSDCKVAARVEYTTADQTPNGPLVQRFRAAVTQNPTVNSVFMPVDVNIVGLGGPQEVQRDIGKGKVQIAGGSGSSAAVFELIRQGLVQEVTAHSPEWVAYGAMDELNRAFNRQKPVPQGVGVRAVTMQRNLPPSGSGYVSPIPWQSDYKKLWSSK